MVNMMMNRLTWSQLLSSSTWVVKLLRCQREKAAKEAVPPTEEVKTHELPNANCEPWCEQCVAGRGQEAKHWRVKADSQPPDTLVVQMDYLFIAADGSQTSQGRESVTVHVAVDDRGAVEACVRTKNAPQDATRSR